MLGRRVESSTATTVRVGGRELLSFAGTGYLGLAHHPEVLDATAEALRRCGLSASASRTTSGNFADHEHLEEALAEFMGVEAAVLLPDGWLADEAVMEAYGDELDTVLVDADAHASLWISTALTRAQVIDCGSGDLMRLHALLDRHGEHHLAVLTDGLYPMQRRMPNLHDLLQLLPRTALLVVDDSHALGFLGEGGRGSLSGAGMKDSRIVTTGSLAKALGSSGGFVAGSAGTVERVRRRAEAFAGTTPIPPAVAAGATAALRVLEREPVRVRRLRAHAAHLTRIGEALGQEHPQVSVPVLALPLPDEERGRALERALDEAGMFVPWTQYGGGPGALRISVNSEHRSEELDRLQAVLEAHWLRP